jgi:hypothetical protein
MSFSTYEELRAVVEENANIAKISMFDLREAHGAGKLGIHVRREISEQLAGRGLGHFPDELPQYQEDEVRVYRRGTPVADIVEAVLKPSDFGDQLLREASGGEAADLLKKVRQLVCE